MTSAVHERPNTDDMLVVHETIRRNFAELPGLVAGVPGGAADRVAVVADHFDLMHDLLQVHHQGEDLLLWPVLAERAPQAGDLVERMQGQHHDLEARLEAAREAATAWRAGADAETASALTAALGDLLDVLNAHLAEEERDVLPLAQETMNVSEWAAMGDHSRAQISPDRIMIVLGSMLDGAPQEVVDGMLSAMPPPAVEAWNTMGKPAYDAYRERLLG
ncbi:MAG: hemerythrin domain-containing protein [Candidatus Nanopelagicales bacterium]